MVVGRMKKELPVKDGVRYTFVGFYDSYFWDEINLRDRVVKQKKLLFTSIKLQNGTLVKDEYWFDSSKQFEDLGELKKGDIIQFNARVKIFLTGYESQYSCDPGTDEWRIEYEDKRELDFKLLNPSKVKRISN